MQPLAFVDLETTGATANADRITEIGIVEVDEHGVREWSRLVNPGTRIPEFIERLTGISNEMVMDAPSFAEIADEVLRRLEGRLFVAHNARFDYGFLKSEFRRLGLDFRATQLCTVKLSRRLYPQHHKHNLDALSQRHGLAADGRHRALADARLIHQFWHRIHEEHPLEHIAAAVKELTARPALPPRLDPDLLDELPSGAGVYLFYGEDALPLYVGKAKGIRKRVLAHFAADQGSAKDMALAQQVARIDWIETTGEIGALLLEAALIRKLQPIHNRQLRRNDEVCSWRLVEHGTGRLQPELAHATDAHFAATADYYGLFKNAREATKALRDLADARGLCHALLGLEKVTPGSPCFAYQSKQCRGACVGKETAAAHGMRLLAALAPIALKPWPFKGPAVLAEGEDLHVVDRWRYLGTARDEPTLHELLDASLPAFDRDSYKILSRHAARLRPLPARAAV